LKDKTRILVTHRICSLPFVDRIVVLNDGLISEFGTFDELIARKGYFADFVAEYLSEESESDFENGEKDIINKLRQQFKQIDKTIDQSVVSVINEGIRKLSKNSSNISHKSVKSPQNLIQISNGKLTEAETSATGSVKFKVYKNYIQLIGFYFISIILMSFVVSNVALILSGLWLSEWSNDSININKTEDTDLRNFRLEVYTGLSILEAIFTMIAFLSINFGCIRATELLHNLMIQRVIRAPMAFFGEFSTQFIF
jgi:ABC-type multidrug transport system fused ATPase/permease subunit